MYKPCLFMMVGLPGSGKSAKAKELAGKYNAVVHASDEIRMELTGNINEQSINDKVFHVLHNRVKADLLAGENTIYDATNINYKRRKAFIEWLGNIDCYKVCVLMATPYEDCLRNNASRERQVPEHVVKKMYTSFYVPYWYEGWDDIVVVGNYEKSRFSILDLFNGTDGLNHLNHDNHNHDFNVGRHCLRCAMEIKEVSGGMAGHELCEAALLHDIGKKFTKVFKNSKGELTTEAHYYNHHHVGAYDSLFYSTALTDVLHRAILIQWHMQPYFFTTEKNEEKYRRLWGEKLYHEIMLLHEADQQAH